MTCMKKKAAVALKIIIYAMTAAWFLINMIPYKALVDFSRQYYSTSFYDRNGKLLQVASVGDGTRREFTRLTGIPKDIQKAFIDSEDSRFYFHAGIDILSAMRAEVQNIISRRRISGASTITMQLAKMVSPSPSRNFLSKLKDSANAIRIELKLSKKDILELYLNNIPFGNNVEGVTSAAKFFFGKELAELTYEEILCLSVIPRRPETYNPIKNPELCAKAAFKISSTSRTSMEKILDASKKSYRHKWHFYVPHEIERIKQECGSKKLSGKKITLENDIELQLALENYLALALENAKKSRIKNYGALVVDNMTGGILCYVGSNDWFDDKNSGKIDAIRVKNQAGSSMKPFLYALALERKVAAPASVIPDIPMEFGNEELYLPMNFNNRFSGPILFRTTLASSLNIGAVTLLSKIGIKNYLDYLYTLGFDSLKNGKGERAALGLALGAGEVTLEELVRAFTVFPLDGKIRNLHLIKQDDIDIANRVMDSDISRIIADILSDKSARATGFGLSQVFETNYQSIFKTGTANQYQNIIALGATPRWTAGVWMGNFDGNTVIGKTGSSLPAKVVRKILDKLVKQNHAESDRFPKPEKWKKECICSVSGMKKSECCTSTINEFFHEGSYEDAEECNWHKKSEDGKIKLTLPAEYQQWLKITGKDISLDYSTMNLKIMTPKDRSIFYKTGENDIIQSIPVEVFGGQNENETLEVQYDDKTFTVNRPFSFYLPLEKGQHTLRVKASDENDEIKFMVK